MTVGCSFPVSLLSSGDATSRSASFRLSMTVVPMLTAPAKKPSTTALLNSGYCASIPPSCPHCAFFASKDRETDISSEEVEDEQRL
jgi:hypothetical protein